MAANESGKTALELALELGIRADTVLEGLRKIGIDAQDATESIDPDTETMVVGQLADDGAISSKLASGKGRRNPSEEPYVNDDLLTQALGASGSGFQQSEIPRQITLESGFEKPPNFFQRMFGKTKNIAKNLKSNPLSDEDVNSIFQARTQRQERSERSPFQEFDREEPPQEEPESSSSDELDQIDEDIDLEDFDLDEDLMENLEEGGDEGLEELDSEDLAELEDLDIEDLEEPSEEIEESSELDEELEDIEDEVDEEETEEGEEGEAEDEESDKEEESEPQSRIERLLSRIQLSPTEMWALMGGSVITMLLLLGVTIYWWLNVSPKAQDQLWQQAMEHYDTAENAENWSNAQTNYEDAIELLKTIQEDFPNHPHIRGVYEYLSESYFKLAKGIEENKSLDSAQEPYRQTIEWTEDYLKLLENLALQQARENQTLPPEEREVASSYVDPEEQREGLMRIALAHRKVKEYDAAIDLLNNIAERYADSNLAYQAMVDIGDTYRARATINAERKQDYLNEAVNAYKKALQKPNVNPQNMMKLYQGLGNIEYTLYQDNLKEDREEDAKSHLVEAIGYYEKARDEAKRISIERDDPQFSNISQQVQDVKKSLADLYLVRGKEAGENWTRFEKDASAFPKGMPPKKELEDAAQRHESVTREYLQKATDLYNEILASSEIIEPEKYHDILYNKARSYHILRDYPTTIAAGERVINSTMSPDKEVLTKTYYLLGDAAWKQAKNNNSQDFSLVKKYYLNALDNDPFYPQDKNGETSNLAEIRLTNIYFQSEKNYEKAIERYEIAKNNYPNSPYTYLTNYYYANALQQYGDELTEQAAQREAEAMAIGGAPTLEQKAKELREDAVDKYNTAVNIYTNAINSRDDSRFGDPIHETYLIEIMFARGHSAYKAGNYEQSIQYLNEALEKYREKPVAQKYIPKAVERLGDANIRIANYDKAIRHYTNYLDQSYENKDARVSMKLGDAYLRELSYPKAREIYRKIVKDYPLPTESEVKRRLRINLPITKGPGFEALKKIAESYYKEVGGISDPEKREEKLKQALEAYQALVDHFPLDAKYPELPNDAESLRMVGNIYWELEDFQKAADSYQQFLNIADDYPRRGFIQWRIANCYMYKPNCSVQDIDNAINALSNITLDSMDTPESYAESLILLGRAYEAKAIALYEEDEAKNLELYKVYMERAKQTYDQVLNTNAASETKTRARKRRDEVNREISNHTTVTNLPSGVTQ